MTVEAARLCQVSEIAFLVVGTGAKHGQLADMVDKYNLPNYLFLDKVGIEWYLTT